MKDCYTRGGKIGNRRIRILELDLSTTDFKGLARFSQNFWDYVLTGEELWDFIMVASIKIIAITVLSWFVVFCRKKNYSKCLFNTYALTVKSF